MHETREKAYICVYAFSPVYGQAPKSETNGGGEAEERANKKKRGTGLVCICGTRALLVYLERLIRFRQLVPVYLAGRTLRSALSLSLLFLYLSAQFKRSAIQVRVIDADTFKRQRAQIE